MGARPSYTRAPDCVTPDCGGWEPQIKGPSTNRRATFSRGDSLGSISQIFDRRESYPGGWVSEISVAQPHKRQMSSVKCEQPGGLRCMFMKLGSCFEEMAALKVSALVYGLTGISSSFFTEYRLILSLDTLYRCVRLHFIAEESGGMWRSLDVEASRGCSTSPISSKSSTEAEVENALWKNSACSNLVQLW